jgi:hypothetical protein
MNPFAQDEGKEFVDKTKLNVLLKLFNRNDWLPFNISFNIMSMPLNFLFVSRDNKTTSPDIANITWFNYFQELNNNKLNAPNSNIKKDLERLEEEQMFSELAISPCHLTVIVN